MTVVVLSVNSLALMQAASFASSSAPAARTLLQRLIPKGLTQVAATVNIVESYP
jgi:hypothetical protein